MPQKLRFLEMIPKNLPRISVLLKETQINEKLTGERRCGLKQPCERLDVQHYLHL